MMQKRQNTSSRLISNKRVSIIVLILVVLFIILSITVGRTFAWFVGSTGTSIRGASAQVDGYLSFEVDESVYGIPGATQPITTANIMKLGDRTDGYLFKIEYSVDGETLENVENMGLSKETILNLGLIEDGSLSTATSLTRSYYGKQLIEEQDLGKLYLKFKEVSEFNINDDINISVKLKVSQIDRNAFQNAYGIPDSQMVKFEELFE